MSVVNERAIGRHHERVSIRAAAIVRAVGLLHYPYGRRKKTCAECGSKWPCRTSLLVGGAVSLQEEA